MLVKKSRSRKVSPRKIWLMVFALWILFLSGLIRSPGVIQAIRLNSLLEEKQVKIRDLKVQIAHMESEEARLEKSRAEQEREIRRVLGYIASDEIVFDFSSAETSGYQKYTNSINK